MSALPSLALKKRANSLQNLNQVKLCWTSLKTCACSMMVVVLWLFGFHQGSIRPSSWCQSSKDLVSLHRRWQSESAWCCPSVYHAKIWGSIWGLNAMSRWSLNAVSTFFLTCRIRSSLVCVLSKRKQWLTWNRARWVAVRWFATAARMAFRSSRSSVLLKIQATSLPLVQLSLNMAQS